MAEQRVRKAIITDAGFASRYLPITKTVPKAMLPLGNRPIMQFMGPGVRPGRNSRDYHRGYTRRKTNLRRLFSQTA